MAESFVTLSTNDKVATETHEDGLGNELHKQQFVPKKPDGTNIDFATETTLAAVLEKLSTDPATQTTLAAILAKIIAAPATEAKQDAQTELLGQAVELLNGPVPVSGPLTAGQLAAAALATETTAAAIKAAVEALAADGSPAIINSGIYKKTITPTLQTSAYTTGAVLFATAAINDAARANDMGVDLMGVSVVDKDDEGVAMTLFFFDANVALGTLGAAPSISDANAANYLGHVDIATTDYKDVGGAKVATVKGINLTLTPAPGTRIIYVAGVVTGTPTFASASDMLLSFFFIG